jgi:hypothetical protein
MQLPQDVMNYIKTFLPPHPLQIEINLWSRKQYFYKWYFSQIRLQKVKIRINKFVDHNNFWINMSDLPNEKAVILKHKCHLDKLRMVKKMKEMRIEHCKIVTHIPRLNQHGNYSEIYYKDQEIVY